MGVGFREIGGEAFQPRFGGKRLRRSVCANLTIDDDQGGERGVLAGLGIEACTELGVGDSDRRAGIGEIELQEVRRRQRVDQQRHEAGAHRAEERGRISRRVVEEQQDAIAALQAERDKAIAPATGL